MSSVVEPEYLPIGTVAFRLGIHPWHVDRLIRRGLIPAPRRAGSRRFWPVDDLGEIREAAERAGYLRAARAARAVES